MSPLLTVLVVAGLIAWLIVAVLIAVVLGRGIRLGDLRSPRVTTNTVHLVTNQQPGADGLNLGASRRARRYAGE